MRRPADRPLTGRAGDRREEAEAGHAEPACPEHGPLRQVQCEPVAAEELPPEVGFPVSGVALGEDPYQKPRSVTKQGRWKRMAVTIPTAYKAQTIAVSRAVSGSSGIFSSGCALCNDCR